MTIAAVLVGDVETTAAAATAVTSSGTTSATGSTFVVFASTTDTAFAGTAITDSKSNTYVLIGAVSTDATFGTTTGLWYAQNGTGGASHTATVHNNATGINSAFLIEITGGATSQILDVHNENNVSSASPFVSGSVSNTEATQVILAFELDNRSAVTAPTWATYTSLADLSNTAGITASCAKLNVVATGTQQSSFTDAAVTRAISWIACFNQTTPTPLTGVLFHPIPRLLYFPP